MGRLCFMMRLNKKGIPYPEVMAELMEFFHKDLHYSDGRIFGSMCTTPATIAKEAHSLFLEANLGNPGLYHGTAEMEARVVEMLLEILGMDMTESGNRRSGGQIVSGGTEANITALWVARNHTGKKEIIFPESAHFSLTKAADLLNMKAVPVPLTDDYKADIEAVNEKIGADTAAVVGIAGTTELGQVDPIEEMAAIASEHGIPFHVDAAFGGFVLPFLPEIREVFDFRAEGVTSLGVDPHKMGLSTTPAGALLFRDYSILEKIGVVSPYLTTVVNMSLSGTRHSASVAAVYAVMRNFGYDGYRKVVEKCMENTRYLTARLKKMGLQPVIEPVINVVAVRMKGVEKVIKGMADKGWYLSQATHPPSLRLVVMPHIQREHIDMMTEALSEFI